MTGLILLILAMLGSVGWLAFFVMESVYMDERVARLIAEAQLRAVIEEGA